VVGLLVVAVAVAGIVAGRASISSPRSSPFGGSGNGSGNGGAPATSGVAARVDPGLVDVNTQLGLLGGAAAGTGMVVSSSGEVLTNNHVVDGATSVSVTDIGNGRTYNATVVGTDKSNDVAVLRLSDASGLATVTLGDSSKLGTGQAVTAIGNAGGTGGTPSVTTGDVTALDQSITASDEIDGSSEQLSGLIQTDASLQPGDSGGPLVDNSARVVGMDTAASEGFQFQSGSGESYSIPIDRAISIARQIEAGQGSTTVHIGPAALLGVSVLNSSSPAGAVVKQVVSGSPASQAGIVAGDVITSLGAQDVNSATALSDLMYPHHPGDAVKVGWVDSTGQQHSATVHLTTGPTA
jgi:S1-C subfamily serine protease